MRALPLLFAASVALVGCGTALDSRPTIHAAAGSEQRGYASFYSDDLAGHETASGDTYEPSRLTAAHRTLPFGTRVEVQRIDTGARVEVRINDRGPYAGTQRIIDLSRAAAQALTMVRAGVVAVTIRVVAVPPRR